MGFRTSQGNSERVDVADVIRISQVGRAERKHSD